MPPRRSTKPMEIPATDYRHDDTRLNNPPAGLADVNPLPPARKRYEYDPRLDPQLQWAGKAEHLTFDVETVPLHIHERVAPAAIVDSLRSGPVQASMFADPEFDLNQAVEFYQHPQPWANRMVLGDSLLVMNSLLEREVMAGKVQCIYFDPPYGIKYGSNFQPFVNKRDVKDGSDGDLTREPEQIRAFRDTWELGIHSYLTYIRDRLLLMRELLTESGSIFVQIGEDNAHRVRVVLDEIFGGQNFISLITFVKTSSSTGDYLSSTADYLIWYAKQKESLKYRPIFVEKTSVEEGSGPYNSIELLDGTRRKMSSEERANPRLIPSGARIFRIDNLQSQSVGREKGEGAASWFPVQFNGREWRPDLRSRWKTNEDGMARLISNRRLENTEGGLYYVRYLNDFPVQPINR